MDIAYFVLMSNTLRASSGIRATTVYNNLLTSDGTLLTHFKVRDIVVVCSSLNILVISRWSMTAKHSNRAPTEIHGPSPRISSLVLFHKAPVGCFLNLASIAPYFLWVPHSMKPVWWSTTINPSSKTSMSVFQDFNWTKTNSFSRGKKSWLLRVENWSEIMRTEWMDQTKNLNLELREMEKIKFVKIIRRFSSVQFQGQDPPSKSPTETSGRQRGP